MTLEHDQDTFAAITIPPPRFLPLSLSLYLGEQGTHIERIHVDVCDDPLTHLMLQSSEGTHGNSPSHESHESLWGDGGGGGNQLVVNLS